MAHLPFRTYLPLKAIAVSGSSMAPTYEDGDWLLFWNKNPKAAGSLQRLVGKIVVIERESYPGILFIKRVIRLVDDQVWVEGDNKSASTDSREWGAITSSEIIGLVLLRYRKADSPIR